MPTALPGARNDVRCVSLEHKLGIHASPTCVLAFGDNGGASAGCRRREPRPRVHVHHDERRALRGRPARHRVAERALQQALDYARERVQGTEAGVKGGERRGHHRHPDVRRMLLLMKSQVEAMRAWPPWSPPRWMLRRRMPPRPEASAQGPGLRRTDDSLVKGWSTETAIDVASLGVQVHGGMGYIEETGAAQYCATRASPPSTKAPPASRPTTWHYRVRPRHRPGRSRR
jgi:alkylation response protein AidB-like acyl-CoA dehydrogenase